MQQASKKIIRWKLLKSLLGGISRSSIDRWEHQNSFPKRFHLGKNSVGWNLEDVKKWITDRSTKANPGATED